VKVFDFSISGEKEPFHEGSNEEEQMNQRACFLNASTTALMI
jgi:hypothetical protein